MGLKNRVTAKAFDKYRALLSSKGYSDATIKRKLSSVLNFVDWAYHKGKIDKHEWQQVRDLIAKRRYNKLPGTEGNVGVNTLPKSNGLLRRLRVNILGLFLIMAFAVGTGIGIYNQFFAKTDIKLAYPATPVTSGRKLSFQGFLTDADGTPIISPINMQFKLYNHATNTGAPYEKYASGVCSVDPDDDGIVNVLIGLDCGAQIDPGVFTENAEIWLGVTVGADAEMEPRQQVANVAYAINAETLQGLPPGADASNIAYINQDGNLLIAAANPGVRSTNTSANFQISSANAITLVSAGIGDITLNATESGAIKFQTNNTTGNQVQITNAQLVTGSLIYGYVGNDNSNYNLLQLQSGSTPADKFVVDAGGNVIVAGQLRLGNYAVNPVSPLGEGSLVYNTSDDKLYYYTSSGWQEVGSGTSGSNYWTINAGAIYPVNETLDVLFGGTASSSAEFAFININSGNPTASISGNLALGSPKGANPSAFLDVLNGGSLNFRTSPGGDAGLVSRLFIGNNGNVGIGTTVPDNMLTVSRSQNTDTLLQISNATNGTLASAGILVDSATSRGSFSAVPNNYAASHLADRVLLSAQDTAAGLDLLSLAGTGDMRFYTGGYLTSNERMRITSGGNVGIGITAPAYRLDVAGDARISTLGSGSTDTVVTHSSGVLQTRSIDTRVWGSTLVDGSSLSQNYLTKVSDANTIINSAVYETDGNVGIGTTAPATKLHVVGTIRANLLQDEQNANYYIDPAAADTALVVSGNVGIGTTAPSAKLDVQGAIRLGAASSSNVLNTTSGSQAANSLYWGDDLLCDPSLTNCGWLTSASVTLQTAYEGGSTILLSSGEGDLRFYTSGAESLFINATNGNVGIGTTAPGNYKLSVAGTTYLGGNVTTTGTVTLPNAQVLTGVTDYVQFSHGVSFGGATTYYINSSGAANLQNVTANGTLTVTSTSDLRGAISNSTGILTLADDTDIGTNALYVQNSGNVGIGTTSPTEKLDVVGAIRLGAASTTNVLNTSSGSQASNNLYWGNALLCTAADSNCGWLTSSDISLQTAYEGGSEAQLSATEGNVRFYNDSAQEILFMEEATGNVGVGTTAPAAKLDINGDLKIGTLASGSTDTVLTHSGNVVQQRSIDSRVWGTTLVDGSSLTQNYLTKVSDANTIVNSIIYESAGGNIGIGTTSPSEKLDVQGAVRLGAVSTTNVLNTSAAGSAAGNNLYWGNSLLCNASDTECGWLTSADISLQKAYEGGSEVQLSATEGNVRFYNDSAQEILFMEEATGNVGVGTTAPGAKLDINGNLKIGTLSTGATNAVLTSNSGIVESRDIDARVWGTSLVDFSGTGNANYITKFSDDDTVTKSVIYESAGGNIGIGTTAPGTKLDVTGTGRFSSTLTASNGLTLTTGALNLTATSGTLTLSGMSASSLNFGANNVTFTAGNFNTTSTGINNTAIGATTASTGAFTTLSANSTVTFSGLGTGNTDTVVTRNADNTINTRSIDTRVWGTTLVDGSSLTQNYLTKVSDANTIINSAVYETGGNVGIGTTAPSQKLDVQGAVRLGAASTTNVLNTTAGSQASNSLYWGDDLLCDPTLDDCGWLTNADISLQKAYEGGSEVQLSAAEGNIRFYNDSSQEMLYLEEATGNVGIGTTAPGNYKLNVNGNTNITGTLTASSTVTFAGLGAGNTDTVVTRNADNTINTRSIDTRVWGTSLVDGSSLTQNYLTKVSDANTIVNSGVYETAGGNVGIGTTAPGTKLDVSGTGRFSSTLTASNGLTLTTGALNLTATSGTLTLSGMSASSLNFGANNVTFTAGNFNTTSTGINSTNIGTTTPGTAAFTTLSANSTVTFSGLGTGNTDTVVTRNADNTINTRSIDTRVWGTTLVDGSSLTQNYLTKVSDANTIINSGVYETAGGNVGIGTTAPSEKLDIQGAIRLGAASTTNVLNTTAGSQASNSLYWGDDLLCDPTLDDCGWLTNADISLQKAYEGGNSVQLSAGEGDIRFYNDSANEILFMEETTGNVGIGTTAPGAKLDINGNLKIGTLASGSTDTVLIHSGNIVQQRSIDSRVWGTTLVDGSSLTQNYLTKVSDANTIVNSGVYETAGGNVGIGTTAPGTKLDVTGTGRFSSTLTASNGLTLTTGALNLTATSGTLTLSGMSASSLNFGANNVTFTAGNFNTTSTGINNTAIGATTASTGAFTTLSANSTVTFSGLGTGNTDTVVTRNADNTINTRSIDTRVWGTTLVDGSSLTQNYLTKVSDANTIINSAVYETGGNVGIGTTAPSEKLDIQGAIRLGAASTTNVLNTSAAGGAAGNNLYWGNSLLCNASDTECGWLTSADISLQKAYEGGNSVQLSAGEGDIRFYNDSLQEILFMEEATGNVGIGTTAPGNYKLNVNGNAYLGGSIVVTGTADLQGTISNSTGILTLGDDTNIGTNTLFVQNSGNVGIGTTAPGTKLDVSGTGRFSSTLTASNGFTLTTGALNLTATSGTLTLSGMSASSLNFGANNVTFTAGNFNTTSTGINNTAIGATTASTGAFTTLSANSTVTFSGLGTGNTDTVVTRNADNTINTRSIDTRVWGTTLVDGSSLTQNYLTKVSDANTIINSAVYETGGNVGIGTTAPATKLHVLGTIRANLLQDEQNTSYFVDPAAADIAMVVSGNVGIGTTAPVTKLDVRGAIRLGEGTDANSRLNTSTGSATAENLYWGNRLLCNASELNCGWLTNANITLQIAYEGGNTVQLSAGEGDIRFYNDSAQEILFMEEATGNVGIGTTVPTALLDVAGNASSSGTLTFRGTTDPKINILNGENFGIRTSVGGDTGLTEVLTILNNGNVGIGTTAPAAKLDVGGDVRIGTLATGSTDTVLIHSGNVVQQRSIDTRVWGTSLVDGSSLTQNYLTKVSDANTIINSAVYETGGNVGIGTTAPLEKLDVQGNLHATGYLYDSGGDLQINDNLDVYGGYIWNSSANLQLNDNVDITGILTVNTIRNYTGGNVAMQDTSGTVTIGTATPTTSARLTVAQTDAANAPALVIDSEESTGTQTVFSVITDYGSDETEWVKITADGYLYADRFVDIQSSSYYADPGGADLSFVGSGAGLFGYTTRSNNAKLAVNGNVGIGTNAPQARLQVASGDIRLDDTRNINWDGTDNFIRRYSSNSSMNYSSTGHARFYIDSANAGTNYRFEVFGNVTDTTTTGALFSVIDNGNVGIGTTAPTEKLGVNGNISLEASSPMIVTTAASSTLILRAPGDANAVTVCIDDAADPGNCTGKIDAGTIDPPYTINGQRYATYLSSMIGIKEEVTGTINVSQKVDGVGYKSVVDLSDQPEASDLWLFAKTTNIKQNIGMMTALLTPSNNARVWYKVKPDTLKLEFYSSRPTTISFRLTAPRHDYAKWGNRRSPTASGGFQIVNPDTPLNIGDTGHLEAPEALLLVKDTSAPESRFDLKNALDEVIQDIASFSESTIANLKAGVIRTQELVVQTTARVQGSLTVDGTLTAGTINSGNINVMQTDVDTLKTDMTVLTARVNDLQSVINDVVTVDNSGAAPKYYMDVEGLSTVNLTVTDTANMQKLVVANSADIGQLNITANTIASSVADLNLTALDRIVLFDGEVQIARDGTITTTGKVVAKEVETKKITVKNEAENIVASIEASGSAYFAEGVTFDKNIATASAVIAASQTFAEIGENTASVKTNGEASGQAVLPIGQTEILIRSPKVKGNSLIYITPLSATNNRILYVESKKDGEWFKVKLDSNNNTRDISFSWWIL